MIPPNARRPASRFRSLPDGLDDGEDRIDPALGAHLRGLLAVLRRLSRLLDVDIAPHNEHEWDAAISILPVVRRLHESWELDLHDLPTGSDERLVHPCGTTNYVWPGRNPREPKLVF